MLHERTTGTRVCGTGAWRCRRLSYEALRALQADGAALIVLVNADVLRNDRRGLPIDDDLEYAGTRGRILRLDM